MFTSVLRRFSFVGWLRYWLLDRNANALVKIVLIAICFVGTIVSAFLIQSFDPKVPATIVKSFLIILAMAGVVVFVFTYRYTEWALPIVVILSMILHTGLSTGTGTSLTFTFLYILLLIAVWLVRMAIVNKKFEIVPSLANRPALIFMITVVIAFFWSGTFPEPNARLLFEQKALVRLMTGIVLIVSPVTYILFSNLMKRELIFKTVTWSFLIFGLITSLLHTSGIGVPPLMNARGQFAAWFVALAFGQVLFNNKLAWVIRVGLAVGIVLWIRITLGLGISWLSGWLPVIVVAGIVLAIYSRKLVFLAIVGIVVWGVFNVSFINETFGEEQTVSGNTRSEAWSRAFTIVGRHFLFGAGPAGYEYYFDVFGYYGSAVGTADLSHNNYVDIVAQTGVVGFTLWIVMWGAQGVMIWKLFRKRINDPFFKALKYSLVACYPAIIMVMMLGDWVTPFPYTQTLAGIDYTIWAWILSGMAIALYYYTPAPLKAALIIEPRQ